ncbi:MAG TPA: SDR family NAD(P)-dependent oxidoreductase [Nocardioides sp.]|uniref:SDR family NAD(P)-dependent oxidoreductase n=1 Tax=Nocardioides sp. TaxID=35761 RepID=UPI002E2F755F|nr:SDR family NAD(P)-dependent oxidoreductase [Nocardioides sp.]HEX3930108.1 SDR family NAD(P)-dependent oxidoreductase [Nocardioides sp.]
MTGAGSATGIGFATARMLGALGASVALTATSDRVHERAAELARLGVETIGLVADLTDPSAVSSTVDHAHAALGPIGILVNNAGMTSQASPVLGDGIVDDESGTILQLPPDAWRQTLARNLDTAYLVTRAALPHMLSAGWGRVVMVASVTGPVMAMRGEAGYAAAKAGMVGLMRSVALDHAGDGVTCNAVAPGWIATDSQTTDEADQARATPLGRTGTPDEVATAIATLCLPGAAYTTGQLVVVDGGNSIAEERA